VTERVTLPEALAPGRTLAGRYTLERLLGTGGMASVWLATDGVLGRKVAAKVIAEALACEDGWLRRFRREARAIAALNHPNVVRVFDLGDDGGRPFIVMQYVPGGSLAARLRAEGAARASIDARRVAAELLRGVAHIHAAGLLHRDIKPGNILVGEDGAAMLGDFGAVLVPGATQLTATGDVLGTARYMAPELLRGEPASTASDLFACGCAIDDLLRTLGAEPALSDLVDELTAPDAGARPRSADAALRSLDEARFASRGRRGAPAPHWRLGPARDATRPAPGRRVPRLPVTARSATSIRGAATRASARSGRARRERVPRALFVAVLAAIALVAVVLALVSGGGGAPAHAGLPAPAPLGAPLKAQLAALRSEIRAATR